MLESLLKTRQGVIVRSKNRIIVSGIRTWVQEKCVLKVSPELSTEMKRNEAEIK